MNLKETLRGPLLVMGMLTTISGVSFFSEGDPLLGVLYLGLGYLGLYLSFA